MRNVGANAGNWDKGAMCTLQDSQASPTTVITMPFDNHEPGAATAGVGVKSYQVDVPTTKLLVPNAQAIPIDDGLLQVSLTNSIIDGTATTLQFFARFLRYDRIQAQYWQVNTPVLTR